jgi:hypothetical protein
VQGNGVTKARIILGKLFPEEARKEREELPDSKQKSEQTFDYFDFTVNLLLCPRMEF